MFGNYFLFMLVAMERSAVLSTHNNPQIQYAPVCECSHILLYLVVGYLSVDLCRTDIAVPEHLAERFHRNTIG